MTITTLEWRPGQKKSPGLISLLKLRSLDFSRTAEVVKTIGTSNKITHERSTLAI
jgi:hypothetical protein